MGEVEDLRETLLAEWRKCDESPSRLWLDAVDLLFNRYPGLSDPTIVEGKVGVLDTLYSTQLKFARPKSNGPGGTAAGDLALWIISVQAELGQLLREGNLAAVRMVEEQNPLKRRLSSFATKFAHFHNPAAFPIWDSRADRSVREIQTIRPFRNGIDARRGEWWYPRWVENVTEVGEFIGAGTFRETDKPLYWWNGGRD